MMEDTEMLAPDKERKEPLSPDGSAQSYQPEVLYITLGPDGLLKIGTCKHCVTEERGRPGRAWDPKGDDELDFDRDTLFAHLADLGIVLTNRSAYVCP